MSISTRQIQRASRKNHVVVLTDNQVEQLADLGLEAKALALARHFGRGEDRRGYSVEVDVDVKRWTGEGDESSVFVLL